MNGAHRWVVRGIGVAAAVLVLAGGVAVVDRGELLPSQTVSAAGDAEALLAEQPPAPTTTVTTAPPPPSTVTTATTVPRPTTTKAATASAVAPPKSRSPTPEASSHGSPAACGSRTKRARPCGRPPRTGWR